MVDVDEVAAADRARRDRERKLVGDANAAMKMGMPRVRRDADLNVTGYRLELSAEEADRIAGKLAECGKLRAAVGAELTHGGVVDELAQLATICGGYGSADVRTRIGGRLDRIRTDVIQRLEWARVRELEVKADAVEVSPDPLVRPEGQDVYWQVTLNGARLLGALSQPMADRFAEKLRAALRGGES